MMMMMTTVVVVVIVVSVAMLGLTIAIVEPSMHREDLSATLPLLMQKHHANNYYFLVLRLLLRLLLRACSGDECCRQQQRGRWRQARHGRGVQLSHLGQVGIVIIAVVVAVVGSEN